MSSLPVIEYRGYPSHVDPSERSLCVFLPESTPVYLPHYNTWTSLSEAQKRSLEFYQVSDPKTPNVVFPWQVRDLGYLWHPGSGINFLVEVIHALDQRTLQFQDCFGIVYVFPTGRAKVIPLQDMGIQLKGYY